MDSMETGQFIRFTNSFFSMENISSNFVLKNIGGCIFTKDVNW